MGNWYMWWLWLLSSSQSRDLCIISLDFGLQCSEVSQGHVLGSLEVVCLDCCLWKARTRRAKCTSSECPKCKPMCIFDCVAMQMYMHLQGTLVSMCCAHVWLFWAYTCIVCTHMYVCEITRACMLWHVCGCQRTTSLSVATFHLVWNTVSCYLRLCLPGKLVNMFLGILMSLSPIFPQELELQIHVSVVLKQQRLLWLSWQLSISLSLSSFLLILVGAIYSTFENSSYWDGFIWNNTPGKGMTI